MKQLLFILTLLIGTCFATHAKTIKLVPSALDSTRMDTVVISNLQDVDEDQNAARASAASLYLACLFLYLNQSTIATINKPLQMPKVPVLLQLPHSTSYD